jgi:membrane-bound ClpP family serine protease
MEVLLIIALIIAGLLLFAVEVFLIPGISVAGIASALCLLYAVYYAFTSMGVVAGVITLLVSAVGVVAVTAWFMHSKTVDRLSLKQQIDYDLNPLKDIDIHVGDTGRAVTRLALIGNAEFGGHILEVRSADGFIDEKTPIRVERIADGVILVQKIES